MASKFKFTRVLPLFGIAALALVACDKHEEQHDAPVDAGAAPSKAAVDEPDLARAVASAEQHGATSATGTAGGPPPTGIFAPGAADAAIAKGAPVTLAIGSEGSEPRVQLGPNAKSPSKRSGTIEIATQADPRQGALPVLFALSVETQKAKAEAEGNAPAGNVVVKVTGATVNAPGVPADLSAAVGKLKGSRLDYQLEASGAGSNVRIDVPKTVDPVFREAVRSLGENLEVLALPFPNKPIGNGGFWMVTSRDTVMGLDVVVYRLVKVEKIEGTQVTLNVSTKRYAASSAFDVEGLPPDAPHTMGEFHGTTEGSLVYNLGDALPRSGQLESVVAAALGSADAKQRPTVQLQTRAVVALPN